MKLSDKQRVRINLTSGLVVSFLYGIFIILFISSTYFLVHRHMKRTGNHSLQFRTFLTPTICFNNLMFATVTVGSLIVCVRDFEAFLIFNDGTNPGQFFADYSRTTEVVKTAFILTSLAIGDCMIVYRLWVVWNYNYYIIAFPVACIFTLIACGIGLTYQFSQFHLGQSVWDSPISRWIISDCAFTLCTNLYGTTLIVWRVWKINKALSYGGSKLVSFVIMLVESAAVFTSWVVVLVIGFHTESMFVDVICQTIGIVSGISFMLINVRVGLGSAFRANQTSIQSLSIMFASQRGSQVGRAS